MDGGEIIDLGDPPRSPRRCDCSRRSREPKEDRRCGARYISAAGRRACARRCGSRSSNVHWTDMTGAPSPSRLAGVATTAFAVGFGALATLQHQAFWSGRSLRPRQPHPGGLVDVARPFPGDHRPPGSPDIAARRALRPARRGIRPALADLAEPGAAPHAPGRGRGRRSPAWTFSLREIPRIGVDRARVRGWLSPLPGDAMAHRRRLPPRGSATPLLLWAFWYLMKTASSRSRYLRRRPGVPHEGAGGLHRGGDGRLVCVSEGTPTSRGLYRRHSSGGLADRGGR